MANRMASMIRHLLEHARATNGALPMNTERIDLAEPARELVDEFHLADPTKQISLSVGGNSGGESDRARLHQALSNLAGNATRYGLGEARITITGHMDTVDVAVWNDGSPIPQEHRGDAPSAVPGVPRRRRADRLASEALPEQAKVTALAATNAPCRPAAATRLISTWISRA